MSALNYSRQSIRRAVTRFASVLLLGFGLSLAGMPAVMAAPEPTITYLPRLGEDGSAEGINDASQVVGALGSPANFPAVAVLWQDDTITDLGTLGLERSEARAINNAGQIVGSSVPVTGGQHAVRWENGTITDLGPGEAHDINEAGQIVGYRVTDTGEHIAVLWQGGTVTDLGPGEALGINEVGQIVGYTGYTPGFPHSSAAVIWENGIMTELETLGGGWSLAAEINDAGQIVGYASNARSAGRAVRWEDGAVTDLGPGSAVAINEAGQIVGFSIAAGGLLHAALWENDLLTDLGDGRAKDINEAGQIVGIRFSDGGADLLPVVWTVPTRSMTQSISLDIKPGSTTNKLNIKSNGVIPVAILSTTDLDATTVKVSTVCFGDAGAETERDCTEKHRKGHHDDVNGDGLVDLVLHFETQQTGIDGNDSEACLSGETTDGQQLEGCDDIHVK